MESHKLIVSFDMDDETLKDISPQEVFALGVEWALFRERLKTGKPFWALCLANNAKRLEKLAECHGRFSECRMTSTPEWAEVWVGGPIRQR